MAEKSTGVDKSKRSTLNWLLGATFFAWIAGVFALLIRYLIPPSKSMSQNTLSLGKKDDIKKEKRYNADSNSLFFSFKGKPAILIELPGSEYKAFSAECTHLNCIVEYQAKKKSFFCNCHGGKFDLNGKNIAGPPPKPLEEYLVTVKNDEIHVSVRAS